MPPKPTLRKSMTEGDPHLKYLATSAADRGLIGPMAARRSSYPGATQARLKDNPAQSQTSNEASIRVYIRLRPGRDGEAQAGWQLLPAEHGDLLQLPQSHQAADSERDETLSFTFDKVYGELARNAGIYADVVEPIVQKAVSGYNCAVFAYGQTGSGKTHTMLGTPQEPGMLRLAVKSLFHICCHHPSRRFLLRAESFEIYNEEVRDLLSPNLEKLKVIDHPTKGPTCVSTTRLQTEHVITKEEEAMKLIDLAMASRSTACTAMNNTSSRSHAVLRLTMESRECAAHETGGVIPMSQVWTEMQAFQKCAVLQSSFNFVDLAGSERASKSHATGDTLREGSMINKSLTTLGMVMRMLAEGPKAKGHIPYRDSKLTRMLQNCLGGNSCTAAIVNISDASAHVDETKNSLRFASFTKKVVNSAKINQAAPSAELLRKYRSEIDSLRTALSKGVQEQRQEILKEYEAEKEAEKEAEVKKVKREMEMKSQWLRAALRTVTINKEETDACPSQPTPQDLEEIASISRKSKVALLWQRLRYQNTVATMQAHTDMLELELSSAQSMVGTLSNTMEEARSAHLDELAELREKLKTANTTILEYSQQSAEVAQGDAASVRTPRRRDRRASVGVIKLAEDSETARMEAQRNQLTQEAIHLHKQLADQKQAASVREKASSLENMQLQAQVQALQEQMEELTSTSRRQLIQTKIADRWRHAMRKTMIDRMQEQVEVLETELRQSGAVCSSLSLSVAQVEAERDAAQAEVHQSRGQRADLDSELQAAQAMCDAATDNLRRLQQDADAAQAAVASLEAQLAAQEASFSAKLAAAADKSDHEAERDTEVKATLAKLTGALRASEEQHKAARAEARLLAQHKTQVEEQLARSNAALAALQVVDTEKAEMEQQLARLQDDVRCARQLQGEAEAEVLAKQADIVSLKSELARATELNSQADKEARAVRAETTSLEGQLRAARDELSDAHEDRRKLRVEVNYALDLSQKARSREDAQSLAVENLKTSLAAAEVALEESDSQKQAGAEQIRTLTAERDSLLQKQVEAQGLADEARGLESKMSIAADHRAALDAQMALMKQEADRLRLDLGLAQAKAEPALLEIEEWKAKNAELQIEVDQLKAQLASKETVNSFNTESRTLEQTQELLRRDAHLEELRKSLMDPLSPISNGLAFGTECSNTSSPIIHSAMMGSPDVNESQEQSSRGPMGQGDPRTPSQRCSQRISQIIEGTFPALQTINDAKLVVSELNLDLNKTNERLQHMIKDVDKRRKASSAVFCQQKKSLES